MSALPIAPVPAVPSLDALWSLPSQQSAAAPSAAGSFSQMLTDGIDHINTKLADADKMVRAFVLDDSIPVHQVTYALQRAQESVELAMQVRSRLVESYQQLMNMQL